MCGAKMQRLSQTRMRGRRREDRRKSSFGLHDSPLGFKGKEKGRSQAFFYSLNLWFLDGPFLLRSPQKLRIFSGFREKRRERQYGRYGRGGRQGLQYYMDETIAILDILNYIHIIK